MALTDITVCTIKPKLKPYKLADEKGLYLLITPKGARHWKFKYRFDGKEKKLSVGLYPEIKLADARARREEARKMLYEDIDPSAPTKKSDVLPANWAPIIVSN